MVWVIVLLVLLGLNVLLFVLGSIFKHINKKRRLNNHSERGDNEK